MSERTDESEPPVEDATQRRRRAVRESMQDQAASGEPILGPVLRAVLILVVVGAPVLFMTFAVVHMDSVQQGMTMARAAGDMPPDLTDTDLYFIVATSPALVLFSLGYACGVTSVVTGFMAMIAGVWFGVARLLSAQRRRAAHRRYGRMVGDDVRVAADAWERDLPEPDDEPDEPDDTP